MCHAVLIFVTLDQGGGVARATQRMAAKASAKHELTADDVVNEDTLRMYYLYVDENLV